MKPLCASNKHRPEKTPEFSQTPSDRKRSQRPNPPPPPPPPPSRHPVDPSTSKLTLDASGWVVSKDEPAAKSSVAIASKELTVSPQKKKPQRALTDLVPAPWNRARLNKFSESERLVLRPRPAIATKQLDAMRRPKKLFDGKRDLFPGSLVPTTSSSSSSSSSSAAENGDSMWRLVRTRGHLKFRHFECCSTCPVDRTIASYQTSRANICRQEELKLLSVCPKCMKNNFAGEEELAQHFRKCAPMNWWKGCHVAVLFEDMGWWIGIVTAVPRKRHTLLLSNGRKNNGKTQKKKKSTSEDGEDKAFEVTFEGDEVWPVCPGDNPFKLMSNQPAYMKQIGLLTKGTRLEVFIEEDRRDVICKLVTVQYRVEQHIYNVMYDDESGYKGHDIDLAKHAFRVIQFPQSETSRGSRSGWYSFLYWDMNEFTWDQVKRYRRVVQYDISLMRINKKGHPVCGGVGAFARKPLPAGYKICYGGLITIAAEKSRSVYIAQYGYGNIDVDAHKVGSEGRFINDFRNTGCCKNVELRRHVDPITGEISVVGQTIRPIKSGEELLTSYGSETYWRSMEEMEASSENSSKNNTMNPASSAACPLSRPPVGTVLSTETKEPAQSDVNRTVGSHVEVKYLIGRVESWFKGVITEVIPPTSLRILFDNGEIDTVDTEKAEVRNAICEKLNEVLWPEDIEHVSGYRWDPSLQFRHFHSVHEYRPLVGVSVSRCPQTGLLTLHSAKARHPGTLLGTYSGRVSKHRTSDAAIRIGIGCYVVECGNEARYMRHCFHGGNVRAELQYSPVTGHPFVALVISQYISSGGELVLDRRQDPDQQTLLPLYPIEEVESQTPCDDLKSEEDPDEETDVVVDAGPPDQKPLTFRTWGKIFASPDETTQNRRGRKRSTENGSNDENNDKKRETDGNEPPKKIVRTTYSRYPLRGAISCYSDEWSAWSLCEDGTVSLSEESQEGTSSAVSASTVSLPSPPLDSQKPKPNVDGFSSSQQRLIALFSEAPPSLQGLSATASPVSTPSGSSSSNSSIGLRPLRPLRRLHGLKG